MGETTIAWTDFSFNPWIGCAKVAPECAHCYAEGYGRRFGVEWGERGTRLRTSVGNWKEPLKWDKAARSCGVRRRVFCASLADVFEARSDLDPWRRDLFSLIERCDSLDWLLLTKRPENILEMVPGSWPVVWPRHVWIGASAGTQATIDRSAPLLLAVPAPVRFLSCEPILDPLSLGMWVFDREAAIRRAMFGPCALNRDQADSVMGHPISWVIVGGESGARARPCDVAWIRSVVRQCRESRVPVFVKQLGANYCDAVNGIGGRFTPQPDVIPPIRRLRDGQGGDMAEWPDDLRVRQWPR